MDIRKQPMSDIFKKYKLEENTIDFLGHAVALHRDDSYMSQPAELTIRRMNLYMESLGKYGDSPFLYPIYGLGGLPESFSRLCAIHGGTYMLNTKVDEILTDSNGKACGIRSGEETAKAPLVICDPSYTTSMGKTRVMGKVIRCICIMDHPIPSTNNASSVQLILPQKQLNRKSDIYITLISDTHAVCAKGLYIAMVSATVESDKPELEIRPAMELLGDVLEMFVSVSDIHDPTDDGTKDKIYVTKSYDATSHFETASDDVLAIYERIVGEKLDLNIEPPEDEDY